MATKKLNYRSSASEQLLDDYGFKWEYESAVLLEAIERDPDSQSRIGDVGPDGVKRFAEQMKQGAIFPPVILKETKDGYVVLDGNTRLAAKRKNKDTETTAYVVKNVNDHEAVLVSGMFNATNGKELTKEELRRVIVEAGELDPPLTNQRLARLVGTSANQIAKLQNIHRTSGDLTRLGVDPTKVKEAALSALHKITDDAVKRDMANLIIDADLKQTEVNAIIKDVVSKGSEVERIGTIAAARQARQEIIDRVASGRSPSGSPLRDAAMIYGRVESLLRAHPEASDWVPLDDQRCVEHLARVEHLVAHFTVVRDLLAKRASVAV